MRMLYRSLGAFVFMLLITFVILSAGNWISGYLFFVALFSALIALLMGSSKLTGVIAALGSVSSALIYIVVIDGNVGLKQATTLSGIIGIPGGYVPVVAILLLIMFFVSFLGYMIGSSFELLDSRVAGESK